MPPALIPTREIGEWHDPETHLIPLILDAALGRRPAISIFGADYPTPDGTAICDYIHVMDLALAPISRLSDHLLAGGAPDAVTAPRRGSTGARRRSKPGGDASWLEGARHSLMAMIEDAWCWRLRVHAEIGAAAPRAAA